MLEQTLRGLNYELSAQQRPKLGLLTTGKHGRISGGFIVLTIRTQKH